jgi:hypothetical protein
MDEILQQKTKYLCAYCRQYVEKSQFDVHKIFHRNDPTIIGERPKTLEEMKNRFEMIGLYDEI